MLCSWATGREEKNKKVKKKKEREKGIREENSRATYV
jgi:hypothetical protein